MFRTDNATIREDNTRNNNSAVSIFVDVTCIDVSSSYDTTTHDDTFISSLVDVTRIDVVQNNINMPRTGNTTTRDDNTCNNNAAVSIVVDVTCIDVSSTENTTTRDDNTFISSLIDVTWICVARNNKTVIGIINIACIVFETVPIVEVDVTCIVGISNIACIIFETVPIVDVDLTCIVDSTAAYYLK